MKYFIFFIVLAFNSTNINAQIRDSNFEKWDTAFHWMYSSNGIFEIVPAIWESNNDPQPQWNPGLFSTPVTRSNDSPIDEFSAKIDSRAKGLDAWYSGIMFQDIILEDLEGLTFWAKCDSLSGNSGCFIDIFGFNQEDELELIYQDSIKKKNTEFIEYSLSIEKFNSVSFDSLRLQFRSKGVGGFEEDSLKGHTIFLIDGVESKYLTNTKEQRIDLQIYPNPFVDEISINSNGLPILRINIIDMYGRILISESANRTNYNINLSDQPSGIYFTKIDFSNGSSLMKKIMKKSL